MPLDFCRWYVTSPGLYPKILENTDDENVAFVHQSKDLLAKRVMKPPARKQAVASSGAKPIIPTPLLMSKSSLNSATITIDPSWTVSYKQELTNEARFIAG